MCFLIKKNPTMNIEIKHTPEFSYIYLKLNSGFDF